jgi:D-tyrosyl-tRNA(Tyr) deacylase
MRILAQRVLEASVSVEGKTISKIGRGLLVLVGFTKGDDKDTLENMVSKTINMRLWEAEGKAWGASVKDIEGEIMVVSQFTLYGTLKKGNKPDYHAALTANDARLLYDAYVASLRAKFGENKVQTGQFQTRMVVSSMNDGPVTLIHDKSSDSQEEEVTKEEHHKE